MAALVITICAGTVLLAANSRNTIVASRLSVTMLGAPIFLLAIAVTATSPVLVTDRFVYLRQYQLLSTSSTPWSSAYFDRDPLFASLLWVLGRLLPVEDAWLFGTLATLVAIGLYGAFRTILPAWASLASLLTLVCTGLFFNYTAVVARQGLASALLVGAASLYASNRGRRQFWILLLVASLLHWSAAGVAAGLLLLRLLEPKLRMLLMIWLALSAALVSGVTQRLLTPLHASVSEVGAYTSTSSFANYGRSGLRYDFFFTLALILALGLLGRHMLSDHSTYDRILSAYIVFSSGFMIFGWIAFSDRLASYGWFVAPLVLWFPLSRSSLRWAPAASGAALSVVLSIGLISGSLAQLASM